MSATDRVTVTTVVEVDAATAFEVFTEEIDAWWKRGPRFRWDPERSGSMRFEPGVGGRLIEEYDADTGDAFEVGRVLVWKPAEVLVFEFRGRNREQTEVEVRFESVERGTRVTVEHRGFDAIPPRHPARHGLVGPAFTNMMGVWWADLLVAARFHVENKRDS